jgi:Mn-dependent DtxR family transcriptional regulator
MVGLVNLAKRGIVELKALVKTKLRRLYYRRQTLAGLLAKTGLSLQPP